MGIFLLVTVFLHPVDDPVFLPPPPFIHCFMNEIPHEWTCAGPDGIRSTMA